MVTVVENSQETPKGPPASLAGVKDQASFSLIINETIEAKPSPERPMRPFFILWTGQSLSLIGSQAVQFALIWRLTETSGSATILATATALGLLPPVALGPVIGAVYGVETGQPIIWMLVGFALGLMLARTGAAVTTRTPSVTKT